VKQSPTEMEENKIVKATGILIVPCGRAVWKEESNF
jgi:hypothetical protein